MKTVITYGTFDLLHHGHIRLLRRLRNLGDRLVVGLSTDEFNLDKGKKTIIPYKYRKEIIESIKFVDNVFPEKSWIQKREDRLREKAHIFAMGDDWSGKFSDLEDIVKVIYLPRTDNVSTSEIKATVKTCEIEQIHQLKLMLAQAEEIVNKLLAQ